MENRGTHNGTKCFVKTISKKDSCKYVISELTMRMDDGATKKNVYMVECVYYDGIIGCTFLYESYDKANSMAEYFAG